MAVAFDTKRISRSLRSDLPVIGKRKRKWAIEELRSHRNNPESIVLLIECLNDPDQFVRSSAEAILDAVGPGPGQEALCDAAIVDPSGRAAQLCVRSGKRPADDMRACLFLFVTQQIDAYLEEDREFQNLRREYQRADTTVKKHVMDIARTGNARVVGFLNGHCKPFSKCTATERRTALKMWLERQEWLKLLQAALVLPLRDGLALIVQLRETDWKPADARMESVHRKLLTDLDSYQPVKATATSLLFERWLAEGSRYANLSISNLQEEISKVNPANAVARVAALAKKTDVDSDAARTIVFSPQWMTRLAAHATGLITNHVSESDGETNYWVTELSSAKRLLEFWPVNGTREILEKLSSAPAEAWTGNLGVARKVLCTIIAYRISGPIFDDLILGANVAAESR